LVMEIREYTRKCLLNKKILNFKKIIKPPFF
jgi:hypothetical protein